MLKLFIINIIQKPANLSPCDEESRGQPVIPLLTKGLAPIKDRILSNTIYPSSSLDVVQYVHLLFLLTLLGLQYRHTLPESL